MASAHGTSNAFATYSVVSNRLRLGNKCWTAHNPFNSMLSMRLHHPKAERIPQRDARSDVHGNPVQPVEKPGPLNRQVGIVLHPSGYDGDQKAVCPSADDDDERRENGGHWTLDETTRHHAEHDHHDHHQTDDWRRS